MQPPPPASFPAPQPSYYPQQPIPPQRGWWSRNWLWFVPTVGCTGLLLLIAVFGLFLVGVVFGAIKSSDAYKGALSRAQNDSRVQAALGTPITDKWYVGGSINVNGAGGNADLAIPISGPKGEGKINARATKDNGTWTYSKLDVKVNNSGETIDLRSRERPDLRAR